MQNSSWRDKSSPWVAFAFCAALSLIAMVSFLSTQSAGVVIPLLCFLPMCFFFSAIPVIRLRREIETLKARLDESNVS